MSQPTLIRKEKMLAGLPIAMPDGAARIHSIQLLELAEIGVERFFQHLNLITLTKEEVLKMFKDETATPFTFLVFKALSSKEFEEEICNSFSLFLREKVIFVGKQNCFVVGEAVDFRVITEENFPLLQNMIRQLYGLSAIRESKKEESEDVKRIKKRLEEGREKVAKLKGNDENQAELADLIGSLPLGNVNLNIINIWELTYYQFYDQFKRMQAYQDYTTNLQSIMAGADPKKVKLKHWIQNIQLSKT